MWFSDQATIEMLARWEKVLVPEGADVTTEVKLRACIMTLAEAVVELNHTVGKMSDY